MVLFEDGDNSVVIEIKLGNFFRHSVVVGDRVFIQEYDESPMGIYVSENFVNWVKVVDNISVDRLSRHFHYIGYDPYRNWMIANLGDENLIRAIYSPDHGRNWKPLYKGPWQFMPFTALEDKLVFGFDSGIARGEVGIYHPARGAWQFMYFKPTINGGTRSSPIFYTYTSLMYMQLPLALHSLLLYREILCTGTLYSSKATTQTIIITWVCLE